VIGLAVLGALTARDFFVRAPESTPDQPAGPEPRNDKSRLTPTGVRGVTDREVFFGMTAPLIGPNQRLGRGMKAGIDTCFCAVNDRGGVAGRRLYLLALDDEYDPPRAQANMTDLFEHSQAFAVVGNVGTPTAERTLPVARHHRALFFGALTGSQFLRQAPPERLVFNLRASYQEETAALVRYLVHRQNVGVGQIAILAQKDGYGNAGMAGVRRAVQQLGGDPDGIIVGQYVRNTADVKDAVELMKAKRQGIKAVIMVATALPAAKFVRQLKDAGLRDVKFASVSFVGALSEALQKEGPGYTEGVVVSQVVPFYLGNTRAAERYRADLKKYFPGERPDFLSLEGYLAGEVLVEGLRRAGRDLTTDSLIAALETIRGLDVGLGTGVTFAPSDHQGLHRVWGSILDRVGHYQGLDLE
jgi:ABC-type branched-subunit amino acid transport system substrate-binding protein